MSTECNKCRRKWKDCPSFEFYTPGEIRYCRHQVIWIIAQLWFELKWPPDFIETGYAGSGKGGISKRTSFDNIKVTIAEVRRRLRVTKTDGKLLVAQIHGGVTDYELLEPESQMALDYISISDWRKRTKKTTYALWKAKRSYYYNRKLMMKKGIKIYKKRGLDKKDKL